MASISVPLPLGSYVTNDPSASSKRLVNVFREQVPPDSTLLVLKSGNPQESSPSFLRRWAGITSYAMDTTTNQVRGMWVMQGVMYAVIGPTLYLVTITGGLQQVGTGLVGSGFVRMTDNTSCLVILVPNVACYTYCPGTTSTLVTFGSVQITDTSGDFTCSATTLTVGMQVTISGTFSGTGSISGYTNPSVYLISSTNGSTSFTLTTLAGNPLTTVAGTTTGATFTTGTAAGAAFAQLTSSLFTAYSAKDVHFVDSYIVFLSSSGRLFYNDDGQAISVPN